MEEFEQEEKKPVENWNGDERRHGPSDAYKGDERRRHAAANDAAIGDSDADESSGR